MSKAAHFLLIPELLYSPPNEAIISAYISNGYKVDVYTTGYHPSETRYGPWVEIRNVDYSWLWLTKNLFSLKWFKYNIISGTSEDPLGIVGVISGLYKKKSICLVDEIKSGSYRGDRSELWKNLCKHAIKKSNLRIVNDESRVNLLRQYVSIGSSSSIIVYPGCFRNRPKRGEDIRQRYRRSWGFSDRDFVLGSSGGFNLTAGADWLLNYISEDIRVKSVIQPLGVSDLSKFLLRNLQSSDRIYIQDQRMDWDEAWESAQGLDLGICIYLNQAPQFQNMGISSNRLCMFIAMGVPVIASRQDSFRFLESFNCGILVGDYEEFKKAVAVVRENREEMSKNCEECFQEYIRPMKRYESLSKTIKSLKIRV
jgi:glycosyltransferase involved in cell wall biosynthesis